MIDLHTHILPGVDDGAPDLETSVLMAAVAAESGVTHLVATPHSNQRGAFENYASPALQVRFDCLCAAVREAGIPLELSLGMEIFGTGDVPKLLREGRLLTINGGRYLLIEFGFHEDPLRIERLLDELLAAGNFRRWEKSRCWRIRSGITACSGCRTTCMTGSTAASCCR